MTKDIPAFPHLGSEGDFKGFGCVEPAEGMSLRDYFAAHAPTMPDQWWEDTKAEYGGRVSSYTEAIAAWNYFYANAMLAEREKSS